MFHQATLEVAADQVGPLFALYGAGFAAVFLVFAGLYGYAWKRREDLELDELERFLTRGEIARNLLMAALGACSIVAAYALPHGLKSIAGYGYALIGAIESWHGRRVGAGRQRFTSAAASIPSRP